MCVTDVANVVGELSGERVAAARSVRGAAGAVFVGVGAAAGVAADGQQQFLHDAPAEGVVRERAPPLRLQGRLRPRAAELPHGLFLSAGRLSHAQVLS